jgi:hypothetical protein
MKTPAKLKKILKGLPPCQERQIKNWYEHPALSQSFVFCRDSACDPCILYRATMITICPYCKTSIATTVVVPNNRVALCRKMNCICSREYRVVFTSELCNICILKAKCLSVPIMIPELILHEKIK